MIFIVKHIFERNNKIFLKCQKISNITSYYVKPCNSILFHIGYLEDIDCDITILTISDVFRKCMKYENVIITLAHNN